MQELELPHRPDHDDPLEVALATPTPTAGQTRAEGLPLSAFTARAFAAITAALRDAASREDVMAALAAQGDVDLTRARDATVDAWCRVEAATARFLRVHPAEPAALVETAERVEAMLALHGIEERGEVFELVSDTMLTRARVETRTAAGSQIDGLLGTIIPWMYRAAICHAPCLPDDVDVRDLDPEDVLPAEAGPEDVLVA